MDGICAGVPLGLGTNQNWNKYESFGSVKDGFVCCDLSLIWSVINYMHLFLSSLYCWMEVCARRQWLFLPNGLVFIPYLCCHSLCAGRGEFGLFCHLKQKTIVWVSIHLFMAMRPIQGIDNGYRHKIINVNPRSWRPGVSQATGPELHRTLLETKVKPELKPNLKSSVVYM